MRANADALYDSSLVPHDSRWALPLPDAATTQPSWPQQLQATLALLQHADADSDDAALYFFRLALLHEDMHHEAALYMAQALGIPIDDARWQPRALPTPAQLALPAGPWRLGSEAGRGFAFDNELGAHEVALPPTQIDAQALRWAEFLPFVDAGGYAEARWWDDAGRAWLARHRSQAPRYLRREAGHWQQWRHGRWTAARPAASRLPPDAARGRWPGAAGPAGACRPKPSGNAPR